MPLSFSGTEGSVAVEFLPSGSVEFGLSVSVSGSGSVEFGLSVSVSGSASVELSGSNGFWTVVVELSGARVVSVPFCDEFPV